MFRRRLFGIIPPPIINYSVSGSTATVTINSNYNIRYTTAKDNEPSYNPTYSYGTVYNNPFNIQGPGEYTIKAIAYDRNNHYSTISEKTFEITEKNCNYEFTEPQPVTGLIYDGQEHNLFSGGSSSVGNNFEYPKGREAKTYYGVTWEFTPNNPDLYCSKHGSGDVTIGKASQAKPTATGATTTYPTVAEASATGGGGHGSLEWSNGNQLSTAGSKTTKARWAGDSNYYPSDWSNEVTLTVVQGNIQFTKPQAVTGLIYNGSSRKLYQDGTNTTPGEFTYENGYATDAGEYTVTWTFTPSDQNYSPITESFRVEIGKANPVYEAPTARTGLEYNRGAQKLLNGGSTSHGTIYYSTDNINWNTSIPEQINANPTTGYSVYWKLEGDKNHNNVPSTEISGIKIAKVTPVLSANPTKTSDWTYDGNTRPLASGGAMKHSNTDSTVVPGTFTYNNATNIGTYTATWSFVPNDTTNYNNVGPVNIGQVTVSPANSGIVAPTAKTGLKYTGSPQILYNPGTNTIPGSFTYTNGTRTNAGTQTVTWTFTPTDSNYEPQSGSFDVTIDKVDPIYVAPTAKTGLSYTGNAQTLYNPGTNTTPGSFSYTGGTGTDAGDYTVTWTFTPTDTINYNTPPSGSLNPTIAKADFGLSVTMADWYEGNTPSTPNTNCQLDTLNISNTKTYTYYSGSTLLGSNPPTTVGEYKVEVTVTHNNNNYTSSKTAQSTFKVKSVNEPTAPTPKSLTYNGNTQVLINEGSVDPNTNGTMVYSLSPNSGYTDNINQITGTNAGEYTVYWKVVNGNNKLFPTDANYRTVTVNIGKASISPSVTINDWTYGGTASTPTVSGNSGNGTVTYTYYDGNTPLQNVPSNAGNNYKLVINIPETSNYLGGTAQDTFVISKASINPTVTMSNWTYGGTAQNPNITGNTGNGAVTYDYKISTAADNTYTPTKPSNAGTYTVRATVGATSNYNGATVTNTFTIAKASINPTVSIQGWTVGQQANTPTVSGNTGNGTVTYQYKVKDANDNTYTNNLPQSAGEYTIKAIIPETTNYNRGEATCDFTISERPRQTVEFVNWIDSAPVLSYDNNDDYDPDKVVHTEIVQTPEEGGGDIVYSVKLNETNEQGEYINASSKQIYIDENGIIYALEPGTYRITVTKQATEIYEEASDTKIITIYPDYFALIPVNSGNSGIKFSTDATNLNLQYSKDLGENWTGVTSGGTIQVEEGDKVLFKGNNSNIDSFNFGIFELTGNFDVEGDIMSLINGEDFIYDKYIIQERIFSSLFYNCTGLINANKLTLSSPELTPYCYQNMFNGCTNLRTAPKISAENLSYYNDDEQLVPAISCCQSMFQGCTSLTTVPELNATTLAENCYKDMFNGCTSLVNVAITLPAETLANYCYNRMFYGCTSLKVTPELSAVQLRKGCCASMFEGCTSLEKAPVLKATTFFHTTNANSSDGCYASMFKGCGKLNWIKAMFTTDVSINPNASYGYTSDWVNGVASSGTFIKNSAATWNLTGNNGIPSGWTVQTASS